jgi:transcription elongation factor GreA
LLRSWHKIAIENGPKNSSRKNSVKSEFSQFFLLTKNFLCAIFKDKSYMLEYLTPEQFKKLQEELNYLKTTKTKEISKLIERAASFGDLSENAAYTEAKEQQAFSQGKIAELEYIIHSAKIIEKKQSDKVQIGSAVTVLLNGEESKINIVGSSQADPMKGNISNESPLGKAILNKSVGDVIKIKTEAGGEFNYKIIKID